MKLIIGLGNPGDKYKYTRHNAGFLALDHLADKNNWKWEFNKKFNAEIIKDGDTIFVKPQTFMNNSGQSVSAAISYYKLLPKKFGLIREKDTDLSEILTVIHDDLDIPLGTHKISIDSRAAGHNGVQSIINHLKTKNFKRIRIGIKNVKPEQMPVASYVLQKFSEDELEVINKTISDLNDRN
jgi:PTH1 family peptidyl-tRNA hydrolase